MKTEKGKEKARERRAKKRGKKPTRAHKRTEVPWYPVGRQAFKKAVRCTTRARKIGLTSKNKRVEEDTGRPHSRKCAHSIAGHRKCSVLYFSQQWRPVREARATTRNECCCRLPSLVTESNVLTSVYPLISLCTSIFLERRRRHTQ